MAMNKKDIWPFVALLALLFAWPVVDRMIAKQFFPDRIASARTKPVESVSDTTTEIPALASAPADAPAVAEPAATPTVTPSPAVEPVAEPIVAQTNKEPISIEAEKTFTLKRAQAEFTFTSRGAGLSAVTLTQYRRTLEADSGPMILDFDAQPALSYDGLAGLSQEYDFSAQPSADGASIQFSRTTADGLRMERTISIDGSYLLRVTDRFVNESAAPITLPAATLRTGPMVREAGHKERAGVISLGIDSLSPGGEKVQHWGRNLNKFFTQEMEDRNATALPRAINLSPRDNPVDWIAVKNKYFVQILTLPENAGDRAVLYAQRALAPRELADPALAPKKMTEIIEVAAGAVLTGAPLAPGQSIERESTLYVGPMKYTELYAMRQHQVDVMEFGMWAPIGKLLLRVLNFIHAKVPPYNYGIAIILLTLIVRTIFWPITHKSTESMKRMSAVAPLVNELRAKYKDNPQRQQKEIMALYKEHKVNPLGGCLPMLIQIPVFIALFVVLRSAIELRFADFLWIRDLSEPENLFPGMLPFGLSLNILPILMSLTMYLQMKFSPSAGDPTQQKMMAIMMPAMMLVFLYNFAAGLALYWTTQNILMIVQQLMLKKKAHPIPAPAGAR